MSQSRQILLGLTAVGIIAFTWGLVLSHSLLPILPRIIALICSVIVVSVLVVFLAVAAYKTIRNSDGWKWAMATLVSFIAFFLVITFVINWGAGAAIRSHLDKSLLPEGNLFEGSGLIGLTYLVLLIAMAAVLLWSKLKPEDGVKPPRSLLKRLNFHSKSKKSGEAIAQTTKEDLVSYLSSN